MIKLEDTLQIDHNFIPVRANRPWEIFSPKKIQNLNVKCFMLEENTNKSYRGHVWFWTWKEEFNKLCGIYGVKGTVLATIYTDSTMKGVADILLKAVATYGLSLGCEELVVPWPLLPMIKVLQKKGFTEFNVTSDNIYRQYLNPLASTNNYFTQ